MRGGLGVLGITESWEQLSHGFLGERGVLAAKRKGTAWWPIADSSGPFVHRGPVADFLGVKSPYFPIFLIA